MHNTHCPIVRSSERRHERRSWRAALAVILATGMLTVNGLSPTSLDAQTAIGQIQRIRNTKGKESCRPTATYRPGSVRLLRNRAARTVEKLPPPEPLFLNDSIRVGGDFDARITIDDPRFGLGDIVLAPRLLCQVVGADALRGIAADTGIYTLSNRGDTLRFNVKAGGAYITWTNVQKLCRLQVVVPTAPATICGTTVIAAVDQSGERGVFHVQEGSVRMGGLTLTNGDVVLLTNGQAPQRLPNSSAREAVDQANVHFHASTVWSGSPSFIGRVFRSPWTYVGLAAAGTAAWYVTKKDDGPSSSRRRIVLRIPI